MDEEVPRRPLVDFSKFKTVAKTNPEETRAKTVATVKIELKATTGILDDVPEVLTAETRNALSLLAEREASRLLSCLGSKHTVSPDRPATKVLSDLTAGQKLTSFKGPAEVELDQAFWELICQQQRSPQPGFFIKSGQPDASSSQRFTRIVKTALWWLQDAILKSKHFQRRLIIIAAHDNFLPRICDSLKDSGFKPTIGFLTSSVLQQQPEHADPEVVDNWSYITWDELKNYISKLPACQDEDEFVRNLKELQVKKTEQKRRVSPELFVLACLPRSHVIVTSWVQVCKLPEQYLKDSLVVYEEVPKLPGLTVFGTNLEKCFPEQPGAYQINIQAMNIMLDFAALPKEVSTVWSILKQAKSVHKEEVGYVSNTRLSRLCTHLRKSMSATSTAFANLGTRIVSKRQGRDLFRILAEVLDQIYSAKGMLVKAVIEKSGKVKEFRECIRSEINVVYEFLRLAMIDPEIKKEQFRETERWLKLLCIVHFMLEENSACMNDYTLFIKPRSMQEKTSSTATTTVRQITPGILSSPTPLLPPKIYLSSVNLNRILPECFTGVLTGDSTPGSFVQSSVLASILGVTLTEIPGDKSRILAVPKPIKLVPESPDSEVDTESYSSFPESTRVPAGLQTRVESLSLPSASEITHMKNQLPHPFLPYAKPQVASQSRPELKKPPEPASPTSSLKILCAQIPTDNCSSSDDGITWATNLAASLFPVVCELETNTPTDLQVSQQTVLLVLPYAEDIAPFSEALALLLQTKPSMRLSREDKPEAVLAEHSAQKFVGKIPPIRVYVGSITGVFLSTFKWGHNLILALLICSPKKSLLEDCIRSYFTDKATKRQSEFNISGRDWIISSIKSELELFISSLLPEKLEDRVLGIITTANNGYASIPNLIPDWVADFCQNGHRKSTFTTPSISELPKLITVALEPLRISKPNKSHPSQPKFGSIEDLPYASACLRKIVENVNKPKPTRSLLLNQQRRLNAIARFEEKQKKLLESGGLKLAPAGLPLHHEGTHFYQDLSTAHPKPAVHPSDSTPPVNRWAKIKKVVDQSENLSVSRQLPTSSSSAQSAINIPTKKESDSVFASRLALKESVERANGGPMISNTSPKSQIRSTPTFHTHSIMGTSLLPVTGITKDGKPKIGFTLPKKLSEILGASGKPQLNAQDGLAKFWQSMKSNKQTPANQPESIPIEDDIEDDGAGDLPTSGKKKRGGSKPTGKVKPNDVPNTGKPVEMVNHSQLRVSEEVDDDSFTSGDSEAEDPDLETQGVAEASLVEDSVAQEVPNPPGPPAEPPLVYTHVKNLQKLHEMCGLPSTPKKVSIADFLVRCKQPRTLLCCSICGRGTGELFSGLCGHLSCSFCWVELGEIKDTVACVICKTELHQDELYCFIRSSLGRDKD